MRILHYFGIHHWIKTELEEKRITYKSRFDGWHCYYKYECSICKEIKLLDYDVYYDGD